MKFSFKFSAKSDNNFIIVVLASRSPLCVQSHINLISSSFISLFFNNNANILFDFDII